MSCDYCWPGNCVGGPNCQRPPMTGDIGAELRTLAEQIKQLCLKSPCLSAALSPVQNCVDHLTALASLYDKTLGGEK